ncbi:hypothetical protein DASC09_021150 [Saccharomycopsis crataegensis]|uniref:NADH:ubiquinone oxidoreductase intermediate-associated protein 30 domain-containing protein n=1 Tax=Saccharomycopsis crataegensis TaxID=43959 RepID=A0AAV5QK95_9ASCO|nr:hypothetical protein DASC09_021150 [Saccharomycopsis crataegensis]
MVISGYTHRSTIHINEKLIAIIMFRSLSKVNVFKTPQAKDFQTILDFKRPNELSKCLMRSDEELGGYSTVNFEIDPQEQAAHFHGYLNLDPPADRPDILQSGYAMFRTKDQPQNALFGEKSWDWTNFNQLAMRVKGDHRKYFLNIQADSSLKTDIYQHRLFLNTPGEWETVLVSLDDFVLTNWGIIQDEGGLDKGKVKTFGIGLLDRQFGSYSLHVDWVKVITGESLSKVVNESRKKKQDDDFDFSDAVV